MMRTQIVLETSVDSHFSHLMQLVASEMSLHSVSLKASVMQFFIGLRVIYDIILLVSAGTEPLKETAAMSCHNILLMCHVFVSVFFE